MRRQDQVTIHFFLTREEKHSFKKACFQRNVTMSHELRRFMRAFVNTPFIEDRVYYAPVKTSP